MTSCPSSPSPTGPVVLQRRPSVEAVPAPGCHVIWTFGAADLDLRPAVRQLFTNSGLDELSFTGRPENFGVGHNRLSSPATGAVTLAGVPPHLSVFLR